jgi:hypothetical protein
MMLEKEWEVMGDDWMRFQVSSDRDRERGSQQKSILISCKMHI